MNHVYVYHMNHVYVDVTCRIRIDYICMCCSVLQCVAVFCNVLQFVVVRHIVYMYTASDVDSRGWGGYD